MSDDPGYINLPVWSRDGKTWPTCYYVPEQLCGEKTICDCPSCPVRVGAKSAIFQQRRAEKEASA